MDDELDRAEELGYVRYRCPHCGRIFYTDGDPRGECCAEPEDEEQAA